MAYTAPPLLCIFVFFFSPPPPPRPPNAAIGANIALVAAGCYIRLVNHTLSTSFAGDTQLLSLRVLIGTVMVMTVAMFASKVRVLCGMSTHTSYTVSDVGTPKLVWRCSLCWTLPTVC